MGFPVGAETIVLTFGVGLTDGSTGRESITITPSPPQIISTALNDIREGDPVTVVPDRSTGIGQVRLLNTDATGYLPTGWTYKIERGTHPAYFVSLPHSLGATVDLADLTPVSADPGVYDVLLPASELGTAAFVDVGQTTGTVAAGDDARFGEIAGIPITGTPAAGKVPTLTSPSAGTWQTPAGGGSGSAIRTAELLIEKEVIALASAAAWTIVSTSPATGSFPIACSIAAAVGDRVRWDLSWMRTGGVVYYDVALLNSSGGFSRFTSNRTGTPALEGYPAFYTQEASFPGIAGQQQFVIGAGEVDGSGMVTFALAYKGPADGTNQKVYAAPDYPAYWLLTNLGPEPA